MRSALARRCAALVVVVAVAAAVASGAAVAADHEATITVENGTVAPNETADLSVAVDRAPAGLSGFDVTLTVADGSVARVEDASVAPPLGDVANVSVSDDGTTVRIAGIDGTDAVGENAGDVRLATVTLRGEAAGETRLAVGTVHALQSDGGDPVAAQTTSGTLTVEESGSTGDGSTGDASAGDGSATDGSTPGFTALVAAVAVVAATLVAARRTS